MREGAELNGASNAERIQALEAHPDLERLLRHEPAVDVEEGGATRGVQVMTSVILLSLGFLATTLTFLFCAPVAVAFVALAFVGLYALARHLVDKRTYARQPLRRVAVLVVDEGMSVGATSDARYTVTLEARDGTRLECPASERVRGTVTVGDVGVAYLKGSMLLEFARVPLG